MKAVVMREQQLLVDDIPAPVPGQGEVLVKTLACGICGSDLHMFHHCEHVLGNFKRGNIPVSFDAHKDVVFGHEYCAEILDHGPGSDKKIKVGTRVCSLPFVITPARFDHIGYSNQYPGGYGEQMVLSEQMLIPVPGDLSAEIAALAEPLTVAAHAVNRAQLQGNEVPVVIGCGPIGLAVIAALKSRGIGPIVAADFSLPGAPWRKNSAPMWWSIRRNNHPISRGSTSRRRRATRSTARLRCWALVRNRSPAWCSSAWVFEV